MAKTKEQKQEILNNLTDKVSKAKSIFFTKFNGLGVKANEELRNKLKEENSEYYVAKKTLLDLALTKNKIDKIKAKDLEGNVAVVFGFEDEVAPAKIVDDFKKDQDEKIEFISGILENKILNKEEVEALAKLPSKQELYARIVGSINAPVSGIVNVLAGNLRGLANVLTAIKDKK